MPNGGRTSVTLLVEARRHNVYNGKQELILSTEIKFVRVDEDGYPLPIQSKERDLFLKKETQNV